MIKPQRMAFQTYFFVDYFKLKIQVPILYFDYDVCKTYVVCEKVPSLNHLIFNRVELFVNLGNRLSDSISIHINIYYV